MDSMTQVTYLPPFVKYFTSERIDNWVINYFRNFPSSLPLFVFMHAFILSFHISTCKKSIMYEILMQNCDF